MSALRTASGLLAAFLLLAASARAEDAAGRAFVEQELQPTDVLVGERVEYVLRVGLESSWRTWLVPEIDRPLDLPVRVASAAIKPAGARPVDEGEQGEASFVLDGHVVRGVREVVTRQGRRYDTITLRREWRVSEAGTTLFRAPRMTIRAGRDWSESLLGTRVPGEVVEYDVAGETARLVVRDPPEEGRPRGWVDAVGRFGVDASLEALRPVDQRVLRVTLRITGSGNLATLTPPGKAALAGFHVLGTLDETQGNTRTLVYDLVAVDAHRDAVEPLELVSYDPEAREYVVTSSAGLPVPEAWRAPLEPEVVVRTPPWVVWLAAGLVALLGLGLWQRVRGAASARRGEAGSHAGTWTALLGALEHQQPDVGEHFTAWVGERLGVPPASLVGEDVRAKLEAAGLPSTVAERTAVALNAFVRARYGAPVAPADVLDADLLEAIATATSGHHGPE
ncbi:MAG: hypothetical protein KDB73_04010 [Planctomycetes bacterium]|nr:hypothetical protein [Planctomycetota bacterium]